MPVSDEFSIPNTPHIKHPITIRAIRGGGGEQHKHKTSDDWALPKGPSCKNFFLFWKTLR